MRGSGSAVAAGFICLLCSFTIALSCQDDLNRAWHSFRQTLLPQSHSFRFLIFIEVNVVEASFVTQ